MVSDKDKVVDPKEKKKLQEEIRRSLKEVSREEIENSGLGESNISIHGKNRVGPDGRRRTISSSTKGIRKTDPLHPPGEPEKGGAIDMSIEADESMKKNKKKK